MSRREIRQKLDLSDEKHFREFYLQSTVASGLIEMSVPPMVVFINGERAVFAIRRG